MRRALLLAALLMVVAPVYAESDSYCVYDIGRLPTLPPGEISIDITGINERDQIVGWMSLAGTPPLHSFIWDRKRGMRDLGPLPTHPNLIARAINDAGVVIGEAT